MKNTSKAAKRRRADARESIGLPRTYSSSARKPKPKRTKHNGFLLDYRRSRAKVEEVPPALVRELRRLGMRRQQVDSALFRQALADALKEVWDE